MAAETCWDPLRWKLWNWVIDANDGAGGDVEDMIRILEDGGWPCPEELAE